MILRTLTPSKLTSAVVLLGGMLLSSSFSWAAEGGIRLNQTRVVFHEKDKNAAATMTNSGTRPYLVKASVQRSPEAEEPDNMVPFVMTPPLFRLEAENRHTLLVMRNTQTVLPADRESVFYLSFLAIPASLPLEDSDSDNVAAKVSVGIRTTIKLFYRPAALPLKAHEAPAKLTFELSTQGLTATNLTPYHITMSQLWVNNIPVEMTPAQMMITPFARQTYATYGERVNQVRWAAINDYGGETEVYQVELTGAQP